MMRATLFTLLFSVIFTGCAQRARQDRELKQSFAALEQKLRKNQKEMSDLREKYLVLESYIGKRLTGENTEAPSPALNLEMATSDASLLKSESEQRPQEFQNEHFMYAKVIESYRKKDLNQLSRSVELFVKTFPQSVHADNALYLLGHFYLHTQNLSTAIQIFNRIEHEFPMANKIPAAEFSRAMAYKELQKRDEAMNQLQNLISKFPGSQESYLAKTELEILKAGG